MDDVIREMLEPERPEPGVVARRRRFVATTAIIGLAVAGITGLTTSALFTNTDTTGQSGFTSGSIEISPEGTNFSTPAANAAPGDTHYAPLHVENTGTLELRYSIEVSGSEDSSAELLEHLTYSVRSDVSPADCAAGNVASGTLIGSAVLGSDTHWIGDTDPGEDSGDRVLASGTAEDLCVGLELDLDAPNSVQSSTAGLAFTFHAEQTANNP